MSYTDKCGWCNVPIDLSDESGDGWVEADGWNACRTCYDAIGNDKVFLPRRNMYPSNAPVPSSEED